MFKKVSNMFKKCNKWCWERPTYDNKNWDKIDNALSMEKAFDNKIVNKVFSKLDRVIQKINTLGQG